MRGTLKFNEPLAPYTAWHIGGLADRYYRPVDNDDLAEFLGTVATNEPITLLGLGSNVLISDVGIRGVVIHLLSTAGASPSSISEAGDQKITVRAEAGMTCAKLAKYCAKEGLLGGEFFAGIPGTVGGALAMNAGAWGGETWQQIHEVEVINRRGERKNRFPIDYRLGYRSVVGLASTEEWFIAGYFQFIASEDREIPARNIKALLQQRQARQPIGVFSCGSVFKNPPGDYAGRLIEASQLKGYTIGDAQVSLKHANFILNLGNARAQEVLQLIEYIQTVVFRDHQIYLEPEVRMLGF